MNYIYCYTNQLTNKKYVGQTDNIERRKKEHLSVAYNQNSKDYNYLFHKKIREYGIENFIFSILQETDKENVNDAEKYWIKELHSHVSENGYNLTWGGQPQPVESLYEKDIVDIKKEIKKGTPYERIKEKYGISISHLSSINHGAYYFDQNEIYPLFKYYNNESEIQHIRDLLRNSKLTMKDIAKETGMSYSTIKKINSGDLQYDEKIDYPIRKVSTSEQIANIVKQMLIEKKTNSEIIMATGVSRQTIERINKGNTRYDPLLNYPLR